MKLPIMAYGEPVLKKRAEEIDKDYPELDAFIDDMFETMDAADGVGLAAPQVGRSVRVIVVDGSPFAQDEELPKEERDFLAGFRREFINPEKREEWGDKWGFEEGCLSIPGVHEKVFRPQNIRVRYYDRQWNLHEETLSGRAARIFQHEYDHLEGVVFTDHLSALTKRVIQKRLQRIAHGEVHTEYAMHFPYRK